MNVANVCGFCGIPADRLYNCSVCHNGNYCGPACQNSDWEAHKERCFAEGLAMNGRDGLLSFGFIKVPGIAWKQGAVSPVSKLVGVPIRLIPKPVFSNTPLVVTSSMSRGRGPQVERRVTKLSFISDLMIDPLTKQSPMMWQHAVEVFVIREDHAPLVPAAFELIATYCFNVLTLGPGILPVPGDFLDYCRRHREDILNTHSLEEDGGRYGAFKALKLPL